MLGVKQMLTILAAEKDAQITWEYRMNTLH